MASYCSVADFLIKQFFYHWERVKSDPAEAVPESQSTITAFCGNFICYTWSIAANEYFISCTRKKLPADTYLAETAVFDLSCLVLMSLLSKTAKIISNELCYPYAVPYCVVSTFHSCAVLMYLAAKGLLPHNSNWSWSHRFVYFSNLSPSVFLCLHKASFSEQKFSSS